VKRPAFEVLVVTPEHVTNDALARVLRAGAEVLGERFAVQARAKSGPNERERVGTEVVRMCTELGVACFVNGDLALAERLGANLHVPSDMLREGLRDRMQHAWISCPAHEDDDVVRARNARFDVVLVSPIHEVPGKGRPRGIEALARAKQLAPKLHVVALGGMVAETAEAAYRAGADAVALMRAAFDASDPQAFFRTLENARNVAGEGARR
jgi:thiamine-phosphate diphosphorylase